MNVKHQLELNAVTNMLIAEIRSAGVLIDTSKYNDEITLRKYILRYFQLKFLKLLKKWDAALTELIMTRRNKGDKYATQYSS